MQTEEEKLVFEAKQTGNPTALFTFWRMKRAKILATLPAGEFIWKSTPTP
jgi:hypothetical protein